MVVEVLAPCMLIFFYEFLIIPHVISRFLLGSILEVILVRSGIYFGALGGQQVPKCHQTSVRKVASEKVGSEDVRPPKGVLGWWPGGG